MAKITEKAIEQLKLELPGTTILTPGSDEYEESLKRWSLYAEKRAGAVIYPETVVDVSKIVVICVKNDVEFVVVGGGHSSGGMSSTEGGLNIDLRKMRKVIVDPATKIVTAQGGCLWRDVDNATAPHSLACVGGTVNHTGVGGLTTGGGFGWLSGLYGMVVDNLLEVEIVLADGKITNASATENPDLFWAVRGAGASFGVVTKFTYRAHEQKNRVWGGLFITAVSNLATLIEVGNKTLTDPAGKAAMSFAIVAPPPAHAPALASFLFYNGPEAEAQEYYRPLLDLEAFVNSTAEMSYPESNTILNDTLPPGRRVLLKGSVYVPPLKQPFVESLMEEWKKQIEEYPAAAASVVMFEFFPYTKIIEVPQTATAYTNRGAYGNMVFGSNWEDTSLNEVARNWNRKMANITKDALNKRKAQGLDETTTHGVGEYGNYDGLGDKGEIIYGVNYERLLKVKKIYDPTNIFKAGRLLG